MIKRSTSHQIYKTKVGKMTNTKAKKADWYLITSKICFFFLISKFSKSKFLLGHVCPNKNYHLLLIITHWSYSKCHDLLHTLNVYSILGKQHKVVDSRVADEKHALNEHETPEKEHQVGDRRAANEISVSEILFCKYLECVDS